LPSETRLNEQTKAHYMILEEDYNRSYVV